MKNLLAAVAMACAPVFGPALAADGSSDASDDEKQPTMKELEGRMIGLAAALRTLTTNVGTLSGNVGTLTRKVDNFAGRGHQVAVVETVPIRLQVSQPTRAFHVDYYLVGHSTIPGFPSETVAATGKFASYSTSLPRGTYLLELQQPTSDQLDCHGNVSLLGRTNTGGSGGGDCPGLYVTLGSVSGGTFKRFNGGFGVYTVTSSTATLSPKHKFPSGITFTDSRPITSYKGAVKVTKLK